MATSSRNDYGGYNEAKTVVPLNTWILISNFKLIYNMLRRPDGTFNRHLAEFLDRKTPENSTPVNGVFSMDVKMDRHSGLWSRIFCPATQLTPEPPVIIFFHGGSFAHSSANTSIYDALCRNIVSYCLAIVVSVDYRRTPEHTYPAAYDDGWTALRWVMSPAARPWLRRNPDTELDSRRHVFLAGDSSGGNIAHHVARRAGESGIYIAGNILLNPMFGGERRTETELKLDGKYFVTLRDRDWYWKAFLPEGANRDHPACNPFGPHGPKLDHVFFPKSLVVVAGLDMLQDWQLNYVQGLRRAGKYVNLLFLRQATIGFYFLPNTDLFFHVMREIRRFVNGEDAGAASNSRPALVLSEADDTADAAETENSPSS
eukprot:TRINITY_DN7690_c0_g1_i1.p1 TRINITY_DN7690_c0_g1~~TRINITY_DN7690_c0_g1_i1.p1  ORF type:complete len:372 (-),score=-46.06 TRINITY_DN7690_c0_g1_i1:572-1687(-)